MGYDLHYTHELSLDGRVTALSSDPESGWILAGTSDGRCVVWSPSTKEYSVRLPRATDDGEVTAVCWSDFPNAFLAFGDTTVLALDALSNDIHAMVNVNERSRIAHESAQGEIHPESSSAVDRALLDSLPTEYSLGNQVIAAKGVLYFSRSEACYDSFGVGVGSMESIACWEPSTNGLFCFPCTAFGEQQPIAFDVSANGDSVLACREKGLVAANSAPLQEGFEELPFVDTIGLAVARSDDGTFYVLTDDQFAMNFGHVRVGGRLFEVSAKPLRVVRDVCSVPDPMTNTFLADAYRIVGRSRLGENWLCLDTQTGATAKLRGTHGITAMVANAPGSVVLVREETRIAVAELGDIPF